MCLNGRTDPEIELGMANFGSLLRKKPEVINRLAKLLSLARSLFKERGVRLANNTLGAGTDRLYSWSPRGLTGLQERGQRV